MNGSKGVFKTRTFSGSIKTNEVNVRIRKEEKLK